MRWDTVLRAVRAETLNDAVIAGLFGQSIRLSGTSGLAVPLLELTVIADGESELWAPVVIQFDQWLEDADALRESERRLRQLFHLEVPAAIGGVVMWAEYVDGDSIGAPNRDNFFGRAVRFRFTPLRERYDGSQAGGGSGLLAPAPLSPLALRYATLWFVGNGPPAASIGAVGDYYLDLLTGNVYGPKT